MEPKNRTMMLWTIAAFAGLALIAIVSKSPAQAPDEGESEIQRGFAINPVPLNLDGKSRGLVGLGSYIVNAQQGCYACHSCPSYVGLAADNPYASGGTLDEVNTPGPVNKANYLAGGVVFGPFVSRNLTPNPAEGNLPAGLTFDQFANVIRTGHDPDNPGQILQVMPWPVLRHMSEHDLRAVYEYLSAIPHAEPGNCVEPDEFIPIK